MSKFAVKTRRDYHGVPTLFLVIDEDECELGRFPSGAEAVRKAVALEEERRLLQELVTAAGDAEIADIFARYKDFRDSLPPHQRERLLAEAQDIIAGNNHGG
jgi:Arc/MetJ-type ribon-helix-helix transcriptional regulator